MSEKRSSVTIKHTTSSDEESLMRRKAYVYVNGVYLEGVISYSIDAGLGRGANAGVDQKITITLYADVTIEQETVDE